MLAHSCGSSSHVFVPGNSYARKILALFDFWKVPDTSKYTKTGVSSSAEL
jgi:hypothetical protein